jgi:cytochrome d ubiquinol oxidase subunit II
MMFELDLNTLWFLLVGVLFTGYAVLDGFDLGVGAIHLFARGDEERRLFLNSIGPVWDGNEVWLVTGGGALFAAFPEVYASVFSGFYGAFMLFLFALIFRAVAIEFRSKRPGRRWRQTWDVAFSVASIVGSVLVGVALGNLVSGVPLDARGEIQSGFFDLLHPYALLVGLTTLALFVMHGTIYVVLKTEGPLQARLRSWARRAVAAFVVFYLATSVATFLAMPHMVEPFERFPIFLVVPLLTLLAVANLPRELHHGRDFRAFLTSCLTTAGLMALFGLGLYPRLVFSQPHPERSLTIYNAASSAQTLEIMAIIAAIGMPLVVGYTIAVYRVFRGKVKLTPQSY